jgi:hypothetical protein
MILVTQNDNVYLLDAMMFSPRRPIPAGMKQEEIKLNLETEKTSIFGELEEDVPLSAELLLKTADLPPYDGVLPLKENKFISHGVKLNGIHSIHSFSSNLESTTQIIAFGHDMFYVRIAPEQTFDRLTDQINVTYVLLAIVCGFGIYFGTKGIIESKKKREQFLLS